MYSVRIWILKSKWPGRAGGLLAGPWPFFLFWVLGNTFACSACLDGSLKECLSLSMGDAQSFCTTGSVQEESL